MHRISIFLIGLFWLTFSANLLACRSPIKSDEEVVFFPTIGYPIADGTTWALHIHGWIYEPPWNLNLKRKNRRLFDWDEEIEASENSIFEDRVRPFFVDNERGKKIAIRLGEKCWPLNNKSASNGHFSEVLHLSSTDIEKLRQGIGQHVISFEAVTRAKDSRHFAGKIHLMDNTGLSIISDLDDTIKISEVRDKQALLANTFKRPFQAVPGMAHFYNTLIKKENTSFHYVSASPWQLYQPLSFFMADNPFPTGSFHLRLFRWKDRSLFKFLFQSSRPHKMETIQSLIECCRERRVILIGDSGEHDPEIYAQIAHQYPQQVSHIFIRDVTGEPENATRYQETFQKIPKSRWTVFQHVEEIKGYYRGLEK